MDGSRGGAAAGQGSSPALEAIMGRAEMWRREERGGFELTSHRLARRKTRQRRAYRKRQQGGGGDERGSPDNWDGRGWCEWRGVRARGRQRKAGQLGWRLEAGRQTDGRTGRQRQAGSRCSKYEADTAQVNGRRCCCSAAASAVPRPHARHTATARKHTQAPVYLGPHKNIELSWRSVDDGTR